jgi:hypothetical protein
MNRRLQTPFNSREKPVKRPNYLESLFGFHVESSCPFFLYEDAKKETEMLTKQSKVFSIDIENRQQDIRFKVERFRFFA